MKKTTPLNDAIINLLDEIQNAVEIDSKTNQNPTETVDISDIISKFQSNDLISLAACSTIEMTTLALNIVEFVLITRKLPIIYFTLDSTGKQLSRHIVASLGRVNLNKIKTAQTDDLDWLELNQAIELLKNHNEDLVFFESASLTIDELCNHAFKLHAELGKLGLIVVDYLQLMNGMGSVTSIENRSSELSAISRGLKALAKDLNCPIIALSQLNRSVEQRIDMRPHTH